PATRRIREHDVITNTSFRFHYEYTIVNLYVQKSVGMINFEGDGGLPDSTNLTLRNLHRRD
ncbi:MAG TPA: hypothetical protein DD473_25500, partial [Planctomycetaceae bacterium]|nr:hypothetical protein [Planctomycetaceae bacterium]